MQWAEMNGVTDWYGSRTPMKEQGSRKEVLGGIKVVLN